MKYIACLTVTIALASCSAGSTDPVDLGDNKVGSVAVSLSSFEGSWDGYVEAFEFPSGSDRLRLVLDASGRGTVELGDAPRIPAFSDPNKGYPESDVFDGSEYPPNHAREGFLFPVHDAIVTSARIKFAFYESDLYRDFCAAQIPTRVQVLGPPVLPPDAAPLPVSPFPTPEFTYECAGGGAVESADGCRDAAGQALDCGVVYTCRNCDCDESHCFLSPESYGFLSDRPYGSVKFDGALEADEEKLVGTIVGLGTVRLNKQ